MSSPTTIAQSGKAGRNPVDASTAIRLVLTEIDKIEAALASGSASAARAACAELRHLVRGDLAAEVQANPWKVAVEHALERAGCEPGQADTPTESVRLLVETTEQIALDPDASPRAAQLAQQGRQQILEAVAGKDASECLGDVVSHAHDFSRAVATALEHAPTRDDASYWRKQLDVIARMSTQAERALAAIETAQAANPVLAEEPEFPKERL